MFPVIFLYLLEVGSKKGRDEKPSFTAQYSFQQIREKTKFNFRLLFLVLGANADDLRLLLFKDVKAFDLLIEQFNGPSLSIGMLFIQC